MKKLLTFVLLAADVGLLIWIVTSEPYNSGAQSMAYSEGIPQASVSQGMNGREDGEQHSAEPESPVIPEADSDAYEEESPVFPEPESPAYEEESPVYEEPEAEGSFDSFLLGGDLPEEESAEEEPSGQDYSQGTEYAEEDPGYYGESEAELTLEDFDWYESVVRDNKRPEGAEFFTDYGRMKGGWKAYIEFDPDNSEGRRLEMLLYVNITGGEDDVSVECDWYWEHDLNTDESRYDNSDSSFYYGNYDEGEIFASGAGNMRIRYFWEKDGTEYAVGTMESRAGVEAMLVMMR